MRPSPQTVVGTAALSAIAIVASYLAIAAPTLAQENNGEGLQHLHLSGNLWSGSNAPFLDVSRSWQWLRGLSLSGYAQTTSGMWVDSSSLTEFGRSSGEHHG